MPVDAVPNDGQTSCAECSWYLLLPPSVREVGQMVRVVYKGDGFGMDTTSLRNNLPNED